MQAAGAAGAARRAVLLDTEVPGLQDESAVAPEPTPQRDDAPAGRDREHSPSAAAGYARHAWRHLQSKTRDLKPETR